MESPRAGKCFAAAHSPHPLRSSGERLRSSSSVASRNFAKPSQAESKGWPRQARTFLTQGKPKDSEPAAHVLPNKVLPQLPIWQSNSKPQAMLQNRATRQALCPPTHTRHRCCSGLPLSVVAYCQRASTH